MLIFKNGNAPGSRLVPERAAASALESEVRIAAISQAIAEAVERALEDERGCADVLQLIAGVRGAINGLMAEVVEDHILLHVADGDLAQKERSEGAAELIDVVRAYLK